MNKILTIVINCYNSTATLINTLQSIDIANNRDVDVLIIDDGSTDNVEEIVKSYITSFPENFHFLKKENGNWGSCINRAIKWCSSRYMSILDSDDMYDRYGFNYVLDVLRKTDKDTDLVVCNYLWKFVNKTNKDREINFSHTEENYTYISTDKLNLYHVFTIHATIFNVELLKKTQPLPENVYYSDGVLIYQALLNSNKICLVNRYVHWYNYCIRIGTEQSISAVKSVKNYRHLEIVFDSFLNVPYPTFPTQKQVKIARKFICNHFYWLFFVLSKDYKLTNKEKVSMLKPQYQKLIDFENKHKIKLRTGLAKFFNACARILLPIINSVTQHLPISFLKASRYTKEQLKKAKAEGKLYRQRKRENINN